MQYYFTSSDGPSCAPSSNMVICVLVYTLSHSPLRLLFWAATSHLWPLFKATLSSNFFYYMFRHLFWTVTYLLWPFAKEL